MLGNARNCFFSFEDVCVVEREREKAMIEEWRMKNEEWRMNKTKIRGRRESILSRKMHIYWKKVHKWRQVTERPQEDTRTHKVIVVCIVEGQEGMVQRELAVFIFLFLETCPQILLLKSNLFTFFYSVVFIVHAVFCFPCIWSVPEFLVGIGLARSWASSSKSGTGFVNQAICYAGRRTVFHSGQTRKILTWKRSKSR